MAETLNASFKFEKFKIPNFSYNDSNKPNTTLNLGITPKGFYNKGIFVIELDFIAKDNESNNAILNVKCVATFIFDEKLKLNEIPPYFYKNSIAIVFPYIRAFVSNVTLQANTGLIILSLMNLSNLEQELIDNTEEIAY